MRMNRIVLLGIGLLVAATLQTNCSSDGDNSTGTGGGGGSGGSLIGTEGGSTGQAGAAAGAGGAPAAAFMSLKPCEAEADYETGATTIAFPDPAGGGFAYAPMCLKVTAGTTVTFAGDFTSHPLAKSTRGDANNPIVNKSTGTSTTVTFSTRGFYPYYCGFHGSDSGVGMAGVVWVQ